MNAEREHEVHAHDWRDHQSPCANKFCREQVRVAGEFCHTCQYEQAVARLAFRRVVQKREAR